METEHQSDPRPAGTRSLNTAFDLLRNARRREVVRILAERTAPVSVADLAATIARRESDAESDAVPQQATDEVVTALGHVHLPKLADAGVVAYDRETETVTQLRTGAVAPLLRVVDGYED